MPQSRAQHPAGTEALRSVGPRLLLGKFFRETHLNEVFTKHTSPRKMRARSSMLQCRYIHSCLSAQSLKTSYAAGSPQSAPAHCQRPTSPVPLAFPPPTTVSGTGNSQAATPIAPDGAVIDLNAIYSRLMLNGGLRVAGAMAIAAVPVFLLFKRPSIRALIVGSVGGFVCGWQSHKADVILRNPKENAALIPKAASFAECAEELQREWATAAKRFSSFSWK